MVYLSCPAPSGFPAISPADAFNPAYDEFTTTNSLGEYTFSGLVAGTYTVMELVPNNYSVATPTRDGNADHGTTGRTHRDVESASSCSRVCRHAHGGLGSLSRHGHRSLDSGQFWTFQTFDDDQSSLDFNTWGVQATELPVSNFTSDNSTPVADDNGTPDVEQYDIPVTLSTSTTLVTSAQSADDYRVDPRTE